MNELKLTYSPYTLKFTNPFTTAKCVLKERKGFVIEVSDKDVAKGIGDAAPLPEFGSESYEQVESLLPEIKLQLKLTKTGIRQSIYNCLKDYSDYPALRHGLEQAILNFICNKFHIKIDRLLYLKLKNQIDVNAVIGFQSVKESAALAKKFVDEGFTTLKIKSGRENFEVDEKIIKKIRNEVGKEIKLRIDVNGKWNLDEAKENLSKLEKYNIEYAEEPVNGFDNLIKLSKTVRVAVAPDESLRSIKDAVRFIKSKSIKYLILKPMMIGGLLPTLEVIELAIENNIVPVITTSFESAIGRVNAVIAAASVPVEAAHGLGTSDFFREDLIENPYPINKGQIKI